jgi:CTD small phosphatase-like protein 2
LNREKVTIKDKLTRDNCYLTKKGRYIKDLRIVKNRELKDIVIIDNTVEAFGLNINNGIPILDFHGQ